VQRAARYVDIYMEAIRWGQTLRSCTNQYSREKLVAAVRGHLAQKTHSWLASAGTGLRRPFGHEPPETSQILALTILFACDDFRITRTRTGKISNCLAKKENPRQGRRPRTLPIAPIGRIISGPMAWLLSSAKWGRKMDPEPGKSRTTNSACRTPNPESPRLQRSLDVPGANIRMRANKDSGDPSTRVRREA